MGGTWLLLCRLLCAWGVGVWAHTIVCVRVRVHAYVRACACVSARMLSCAMPSGVLLELSDELRWGSWFFNPGDKVNSAPRKYTPTIDPQPYPQQD